LIAARGVDFDGMTAGSCPGPGLMAKLQKCHKFSDYDEDRRKAGLSEPAKF
jgi:hypothetical protein